MKFLKILLGILLICQTVHSQVLHDSLTAELNRYLDKAGLPGFSVVILQRGKPVYQHGFGYADVQDKRKFTSQTIHNIGSVSKTVVAVALMKAIGLKYFTLDTDINEILPFRDH